MRLKYYYFNISISQITYNTTSLDQLIIQCMDKNYMTCVFILIVNVFLFNEHRTTSRYI